MPRLSAEPKNNYMLVKVAAAAIAVGLHLSVLAAIFSRPETPPEITLTDGADVQFVEISGDIVEDAPGEPLSENVEVAAATVQQEPAPPDMQPEEPSAEPAPELPVETPEETPEEPPKTEFPEPPPPEPEPDPPAVSEPQPEAGPPEEVAPEAIREPELKPEPKPEPKPKPSPKPKPVVKAPKAPAKPAPIVRPQAAPSVAQVAAAAGSTAVSDAAVSPQASAKNPDRPRLVSKVDYQGRRPNPVYPRASERRGEQGRVVVRVLISAQGTVSQVSVQSSSGYDRLDEAALKAARTARFKPYMENGIAYQALADIPFDFVL